MVNLLLGYGASPDARRKRFYKTALHEAVCGSLPIVTALVEQGADVNATESLKERTPLWRATNCNNTEAIAYLESKGARYTVDDAWYRMATPFEKAAADGDIKTMKQMLAKGQDVNARDAFGDTALHFAAAGGQVKAMKWLVKQGALPMFRGGLIQTPLFWAAYHGQIDACHYLMKKGCRVKDTDLYKDTPLHQAARGNQPAVVKLFLEKGADANASSKKTSPLMAAARTNAGDAMEALIAGGADVSTHGRSQRTALHDAVLYNSPDAARVLLAHNADLRAKDYQDYTPLEAAKGNRDTSGGDQVYRHIMAKVGTPISTSYDCDRAVDAVERLVCADRDLAELDVDMDRYYQVLMASFDRKTAGGLKEEQRHWLQEERGACVFSRLHYPEDDAFYSAIKCLKPRYQQRIHVLKRSVSRHGFSMDVVRDAVTSAPGVNTWGASMNLRKDAPKNRFKAFYYNTNDPTNVVASEEVDQVSVNYAWDKFHGIKSENFGAYWVGDFEFKQARQMMFQVALSRSRVKIVVNGKAIHDSEISDDMEIPHTFRKGKHIIEVEFANNWHTTDVLVRLAEPEPVYNAEDGRMILGSSMSPETHLWYTGVYESEAPDHSIRLSAKAIDSPVVLLLSSYNAVNWIIPNTEQNRIKAVFYASRDPGASVSLPSDKKTKVYRLERDALKNVYKLPKGWWAGVENLSDNLEPLLGSHRLDGFTGTYETGALLIPSLTPKTNGKRE